MTEPTGPEQAIDTAAVERLMLMLDKGLRAFQLYPPNNPVYQKAVENVRTAFESVWEEWTELEFQVSETELVWEEAVVLSQPDKAESLAWIMFKDGLRSLTMVPGVEDREIVGFLDALQQARHLPRDAPDDLLTLLWQYNFQLIRYTYIELGEEEVPSFEPSAAPQSAWGVPAASPAPVEVQRLVGEETVTPEGGEAPSDILKVEDFDSTLYFLDESEINKLRNAIDQEYQQDLRATVLAMLFDILELEPYAAARERLISIIENLLPHALAEGDFHSVATILRELKVVLERAEALEPEHRQALEDLPPTLSEPEAIAQLLQSLDDTAAYPTEDEVSELFSELRPAALTTVLTQLAGLKNERVRDLLAHAVQRVGRAHPEHVMSVLKTEDEALLLQAVHLVTQMKLPAFVPPLGGLLDHPSARIRRVATAALGAIGSPTAMKHLERVLDDPEAEVRSTAVLCMAEHGHRGSFPKIEAAIGGRALRVSELTEKQSFFEAYGRIPRPVRVLPWLWARWAPQRLVPCSRPLRATTILSCETRFARRSRRSRDYGTGAVGAYS
jgi:HEAT repeat protein